MASHSAQTVDKPTHRKNADKIMRRKIKNHISKRISHSRKKRLCESIFAYCVNRPSTYLCTPVGAVSLSACVSQRLQRVEKYFFDTLGGMWLHIPLCYTIFHMQRKVAQKNNDCKHMFIAATRKTGYDIAVHKSQTKTGGRQYGFQRKVKADKKE